MKNEFSLDYCIENDILVISVSGSASAITAASLQSQLSKLIQSEATEEKTIVLDAKKLEYVSSAGLRAILQVAKSVAENNQSLRICSLNDSVETIFKTAGFDKIIPIYKDRRSAMPAEKKSFKPSVSI